MNKYQQAYSNWLGGRRYKGLVNITKQQWCQWWEATRLFDMRGNSKGSVYMARLDKQAPFSLDNIELKVHGLKNVKLVTRGFDMQGWDC